MRNDITAAPFDRPNASREMRHTSANSRVHSPVEHVHVDRRRNGDMTGDLPRKALSPVSDFEGFGSFSS